MTNVDEIGTTPAAAAVAQERRRPGRLPHVSQELVPLLRTAGQPSLEPQTQFGDPDQMGSARGLALGVTLSAALWAGIAFAVRWFLS